MAMQRKTKFINKVLHFYCTAGDHFCEESEFYRNRSAKFRISSNCKGCSKGLSKTKYKASQSKRSESYHFKRQTAMKRVEKFEAWRKDFMIMMSSCWSQNELGKSIEEMMAI